MPLTPSLLVPGTAEEMANYYADVFPDARFHEILRMTMPDGHESVITARLELNGTELLLVNGGPGNDTTFTEAFSLTINCADQVEVDHFWGRLVGDGGQEVACGWCRDKFGVFWQVIPTGLPALLSDPDPDRAKRAFEAMQTMIKIDIDAIRQAAGA